VLIFGGWADLVGCAGSQGMPEAREPSLAPELWPTCNPWLPCPANVMLVLGKAIVHDSDLVCVGGRVLCKQTAALAREAEP